MRRGTASEHRVSWEGSERTHLLGERLIGSRKAILRTDAPRESCL